jgi:hypothetical protein
MQINFSFLQLILQDSWQGLDIDLEPHGEGCRRADARSHAAELLALDCFMKPELATPEILIAEGVIAKDLLAFSDQVHRVVRLRLHTSHDKQDSQQETDS